MKAITVLAEPTRLAIVELLAKKGQLSAGEICVKFHASPSAISQHLKVLRKARLVKVERQAQRRIYRLNPDAMLEVAEWTKKMTHLWHQRIENGRH